MNLVTDNELLRSVFQASQEIEKRFYRSTWPMRNDLNLNQALNVLIIDHTDNPAVIRQYVSIDAAWRDAEIRRDWASALRAVKHGEDLSHDIDWAFSPRDIKNLAKLHKANRFRKKIENLLDDCNFHTEAALMSSHQYDKLLNEEDVDE